MFILVFFFIFFVARLAHWLISAKYIPARLYSLITDLRDPRQWGAFNVWNINFNNFKHATWWQDCNVYVLSYKNDYQITIISNWLFLLFIVLLIKQFIHYSYMDLGCRMPFWESSSCTHNKFPMSRINWFCVWQPLHIYWNNVGLIRPGHRICLVPIEFLSVSVPLILACILHKKYDDDLKYAIINSCLLYCLGSVDFLVLLVSSHNDHNPGMPLP